MTTARGADAQAAFDRAQNALAAGDLAEAHRLFEYAQRLAPSDAAITLSIGMVRLQRRDPSAAEPFGLVAARLDVREAWLGLAAAHHIAARNEQALAAMARALNRHAPAVTAATLAFQDELTRSTGLPGWCGLASDGVLLISPVGASGALSVTLDGRPMALPPRRGGRPRISVPLPPQWRQAKTLSVTCDGVPFIGSPIAVPAIIRVEGFVAARDRGLEGWAWLPGDPDRDVPLLIRSAHAGGRSLRVLAADERHDLVMPNLLARPRGFSLAAADLSGFDEGPLEVVGEDGRILYGCPLDPQAEVRSAAAACGLIRASLRAGGDASPDVSHLTMPAIPADIVGPAPTAKPRRRGVDVVIPVYRGVQETLACLESVLAGGERWMRVLVVDDASPDAALVAALEELAASGRIVLVRQEQNGGFPRAVNAGLVAAGKDRDVVLLNSDTLVPRGWLARLRDAALSAPDIGTVTPLSNDATIMSYPYVDRVNPIPDLAETQRLDTLARTANGRELTTIPTAIGFCMYIRRDCLDAVGPMRADVFAQGYGEENDFCLRARHLGWRNVGLTGLFVGHVGGISFGAAKAHLIVRNLEVLNRLHPGYEAMIEAFHREDPLLAARQRMDAARWREGRSAKGAVLLLTHDRVGGVLRRVQERCAAIQANGLRPIVLAPRRLAGGGSSCLVDDNRGGSYPNLCFKIPGEIDSLVTLLAADRPVAMELHHFIGHHPAMLSLADRLAIPCEVVIHDYSWFCPRITLVGAGDRYCGEPDMAGCEACIADLGSNLDETITPTALVTRSSEVLAKASRVIAPAADVARRMRTHFPRLRSEVVPWESDATLPAAVPPRIGAVSSADRVRICVVGAIGTEKGYDLLLACARDAIARRLMLEFLLVGHSRDDQRLLATGAFSITGPYDEPDAVALIRTQRADLALLPSIWPETWSYVLSRIWAAGLPVMAFDIGTPAERIRATGRGWILPLGLGPAAVNNALLAQGTARRTGSGARTPPLVAAVQ
jgi:GT2 family glycosyltransferase/glycosyltransferase involved in cell wall biosynthesis